jgi:PAS domain-containing protein
MLMKSLSGDKGAATTKEFEFIGVAQEILETIGDGFCAIDGEWNIVYVNLAPLKCGDWRRTG